VRNCFCLLHPPPLDTLYTSHIEPLTHTHLQPLTLLLYSIFYPISTKTHCTLLFLSGLCARVPPPIYPHTLPLPALASHPLRSE